MKKGKLKNVINILLVMGTFSLLTPTKVFAENKVTIIKTPPKPVEETYHGNKGNTHNNSGSNSSNSSGGNSSTDKNSSSSPDKNGGNSIPGNGSIDEHKTPGSSNQNNNGNSSSNPNSNGSNNGNNSSGNGSNNGSYNNSVDIDYYNGIKMNYVNGSGYYTSNIRDGSRNTTKEDGSEEINWITSYNYWATQRSGEFKSATKISHYKWVYEYRQNENSNYSVYDSKDTQSNVSTIKAKNAGYYRVSCVPVVYDEYSIYQRTLTLKGLSKNGSVIGNIYYNSGVTPTINFQRKTDNYEQTNLKKNWEIYLQEGTEYKFEDTIIIKEIENLNTKTNLIK